jgi:hypothetical protein
MFISGDHVITFPKLDSAVRREPSCPSFRGVVVLACELDSIEDLSVGGDQINPVSHFEFHPWKNWPQPLGEGWGLVSA